MKADTESGTACVASRTRSSLFRITTRAPTAETLEHVSILLGFINHLVEQGDLEDDHKLLGAAGYLSAFAKAIMDEMEVSQPSAS
ncbi:DUF3077 domain-containing protein [Pseudomonas sp. RP23018S]|uniref:DUF3077 domain-containing protein n=1 Tax=Pseudomonas sp. RP23018S TaxID=3096037 RepID=UPI002ACA1B08|nr:DUF3077 domain-containing protein [Pseudomonas sp. RP23018S]MDZ5602760.1 DUF3077 domain-containing protein [Pseudomonas sp. RP23018S]